MASTEEKTKAEGASETAKEPEKEEATKVAEGAAAAASETKTEPAKVEEKGGEKIAEEAQTSTAEGEDATAAETTAERSKRVYVGNLAWEVKSQDLTDHMTAASLEVVSATVMTTPDGRSKGCGIVEFATVEAAQKAVETMNDTELKGRQIFVREDREERKSGNAGAGYGGGSTGTNHHFSSGEYAKSRRVYVGNLSWDVAWQDLKDHMREAGEVVHAEIISEHTGRSKGCGIVEYASEEGAQAAIATLTDTELKGRMIFVREDRETTSQAGGGGSTGRVQNTSVYVWNLTPDTSWQDLKDHMRQAGNVDSATILMNNQGESVCCGVVVYQRPQEAARAIRELQSSELKGKPISVREDRAQGGRGGRGRGRGRGGRGGGHGGRGGRGGYQRGGGGDHESQVYVGNLSQDTSWRELKDHFRQCGEVGHAEVKTNYHGQSRGFGFVQFSSKAEAEAAVSRLNGSELQGCKLEVRLNQRHR